MKYLTVLLFIATLYSCNSKPGNDAKNDVKATVVKEAESEDLTRHPGYALYQQHCLPCHQADGNGVPGMYPGLHNTKWVIGDKKELITIVLDGMEGEIEVNGETYNAIMAPLPHLTDQEVADVLTYVRKEYGRQASEVKAEEVREVRNSL